MKIESTTDSKEDIQNVLAGRGGKKPADVKAENGDATITPGDGKTVEAAAEAPAKAESEPSAPAADKSKPKGRFQERIDAVVKRESAKTQQERDRANRAELEAQRLRDELAAARAKPADPAPKPATAAADTANAIGDDPNDPEPKVESDEFDSTVDWQKAHSAWTIRKAARVAAATTDQKLSERDRVTRDRDAAAAHVAAQKALAEHIETFAEAHPDYDAVVGAFPQLPREVIAAVDRAAGESVEGVELTYEYCKSPQIQKRLAQATDSVQRLVIMGEFIASVRAARKSSRPAATARATETPLSTAPDASSQAGRVGRVAGSGARNPVAIANGRGSMADYRASRGLPSH